MAGLPPVLYFPYIDLDAGVVKAMLTLFRQIQLLQPSFTVPAPSTEECGRKGWVRVWRRSSPKLDTHEARRLLRDYERLGDLHHDSGYLAYLKHGGVSGLEEERGYEILREIRRYGQTPGPADGEEALRGQILLQMAQDLDRQRREIKAALGELHERERSLQRALRLEVEEDDETIGWEVEPLPDPEEDGFLIPQRLRAWGEMFAALREAAPAWLMTDNRMVVSHLLEMGAGPSAGARSRPLPVLRLRLPRFAPEDFREVARIRRTMGELLPWRIFCERFEAVLAAARRGPWSEDSSRDILATGRALSSYFQETVMDQVLEQVAGLGPSLKDRWRELVLEVMLFPETTEAGLLRGQETGGAGRPDHHTLILHLED